MVAGAGWLVLALVFLDEVLAAVAAGIAGRPVVKVLVFGLVSLGLWAAGHPGWVIALLVFSLAVNRAAQLRAVRALVAGPSTR